MILSSTHAFFESAADIKQICAPLQGLNISHFSYTRAHKNGQRIYLSTDADVLADYFQNEFYLIGHCEHQPNYYTEQVLLWSSLPNQRMFETAKAKGITEGIFVIKPYKEYVDFFNFASHINSHDIINIYLTYIQQLKFFMDLFKKEAQAIIQKAEKSSLILPYQNDPFTALQKKHLSFPALTNRMKLSRQQYECAVLLLRGKSNKEIANELDLSPRTIESYIVNMKNKLQAQNRTELILTLAKIVL